MDSDKIIVMNYGKVEEFGTPSELLELPMGIFKDMINAAGAEAEKLKKIAKGKHESLQEKST